MPIVPDRRRYLLFRLIFFAMQAPVAVLLPYFVLYLSGSRGFDPRQISYVTMVSGLAIILTQQLWGYLGDVRVSKRQLILANCAISSLLFLLVGRMGSLPALLAMFFLFQVVFTPILQLLHGFLFMHENSDLRFGQLRAYGSLGFVVVNILMGIFADRVMGGRLEFIFPAFGIVVMSGAALLYTLPDRVQAPETRRPGFVEVQRYFLSQWQVSVFLLFILLYQAGHSFSYTLQSVLMREMGADNTVVASSYSLAAIVELPVFFAANRLIRRFGELRLLAFAAAVQALRWLLVWRAESPGEVVLISLMHCVTFGIFYVCSVTYMNRHAGPALQGERPDAAGPGVLWDSAARGQPAGRAGRKRGVAEHAGHPRRGNAGPCRPRRAAQPLPVQQRAGDRGVHGRAGAALAHAEV